MEKTIKLGAELTSEEDTCAWCWDCDNRDGKLSFRGDTSFDGIGNLYAFMSAQLRGHLKFHMTFKNVQKCFLLTPLVHLLPFSLLQMTSSGNIAQTQH